MNNPMKRRRVFEINIKTRTESPTENVLGSRSKVETSKEEVDHKAEKPLVDVEECIPSQSDEKEKKLNDEDADSKSSLRDWYKKTIDRETVIEDNPPRRA